MKMNKMIGKSLSEYPVLPDTARAEPHTSVGIEVELEGVRVPEEMKYWRESSDGSLQNGIELISVPVWGTAIDDALRELDVVLSNKTPNLSFRTSIHVHINILDIESESLAHSLRLYTMYEKPLFRIHSAWGRYENLFCVPAAKSYRILSGYGTLIADLESNRLGGPYIESKYSALNTTCLLSLGTIEYRHMGGTVDTEAINQWINILLHLKHAARELTDVEDHNLIFGELNTVLGITEKDKADGREALSVVNLIAGQRKYARLGVH